MKNGYCIESFMSKTHNVCIALQYTCYIDTHTTNKQIKKNVIRMTPVGKILTWFLFYIASSEFSFFLPLSIAFARSSLILVVVFNVNFSDENIKNHCQSIQILWMSFIAYLALFLSQFIVIHIYSLYLYSVQYALYTDTFHWLFFCVSHFIE